MKIEDKIMSRLKLKKHTPKRGKYVRYRIRLPSLFKKDSLRTHDIGRKGHSKRIAGKHKKTGKWLTQAILITKSDAKLGTHVKLDKQGRPKIFKSKTKTKIKTKIKTKPKTKTFYLQDWRKN